jgi:ribonuclease D
MARTLLDAIEVRLYREDLERVRRLADERERWARTIERVDQEVIANVVLWRVYE